MMFERLLPLSRCIEGFAGRSKFSSLHVAFRRFKILATSFVALAFLGSHAPASAAGAVSFRGKVITLDVATGPGGGYDFYSRVLAQFLPRHLPGSPTVVVRNMPGAGGLVLANRLYDEAPPDGSEIGAFESDTAFTPILTGQTVAFDPKKFQWLGSLDKFVPMVLAWHTSSFHSFTDLMARTMTVGSSGLGSVTSGYPYSLAAFLGAKFKVISGYPGSSDINLALERGELDGYAGWCWDCLKQEKPNWLAEKQVRILLQLSFEGDPELNAMGVPTVADVAKTPEQRQMMRIVLASASFGRPYALPPGVPPDVARAWKKAFAETAADPDLINYMQSKGSKIRFSPPSDVERLLASAEALDPKTLARLRAVYMGRAQNP
jgi:tripartite-type tricarboxylate transporter receptor subunit TctC